MRELISKRNLVPDDSFLHVENWPWSLKIYTLGPFGMVRDGETVRFSGKVQQKPLLLLKILIAFGGRNVKEEHLCDAIWPDAEGDLAHHSLETTIYRLRKLIGKDNTVQLNEGCLTLDRQSCWVDAFALEKALNQAEGLFDAARRCQTDPQLSRDAANEAIQLIYKAIGMYKGHFLEAEPEQSWLIAPQKRLRARIIRGIESLAGYWKMTGELEKAINCYEKVLEIDDRTEEVYQHLMIIYHQLGQREIAIEVYNKCRSVLEFNYGIEPSPKTREILKILQRAQPGAFKQ